MIIRITRAQVVFLAAFMAFVIVAALFVSFTAGELAMFKRFKSSLNSTRIYAPSEPVQPGQCALWEGTGWIEIPCKP